MSSPDHVFSGLIVPRAEGRTCQKRVRCVTKGRTTAAVGIRLVRSSSPTDFNSNNFILIFAHLYPFKSSLEQPGVCYQELSIGVLDHRPADGLLPRLEDLCSTPVLTCSTPILFISCHTFSLWSRPGLFGPCWSLGWRYSRMMRAGSPMAGPVEPRLRSSSVMLSKSGELHII